MKLPIKITPDRLKDTIVELKYFSILPFEIIIGFVYSSLDETYAYTFPQLSNSNPDDNMVLSNNINIKLGGKHLFYTENISIELRPGSFIFNCIDEYMGWDGYFDIIKKTITQINKIKEIEYYNRIGIRYISEYFQESLLNICNINFSLGIEGTVIDTFSFNTNFVDSDFKINMNLWNNINKYVPTVNAGSQKSTISIIDIDVIIEDLKMANSEDLFQIINKGHLKLKELFFSTLKSDYLEKLNPEY